MEIKLIKMKTIYNVFFTIWIVIISAIQIISAQEVINKSVPYKIEVLMSGKMLDDINLKIEFIPSVNMTSNGHILLSSPTQFHLLGWGGIKAFGNKYSDIIGGFDYSYDGFLMVVHNSELCYIDSIGNLAKLYELPNKNMGITAGKSVMYLFDKDTDLTKYALYILSQGKRYTKLFEIPTPINAVSEIGESLLFSTGNKLFYLNAGTNTLKAIVSLPQKESKIISIVQDRELNTVYFSSNNAIYAMKDTSIVCISDKLGGVLRLYDKGLLIFNAEKRFLVSLLIDRPNANTTIDVTNAEDPANKTLNNKSIIQMIINKTPEDEIIKKIENSVSNFNVSIDDMVNLSDQGVSSAVILAMKKAMKNISK